MDQDSILCVLLAKCWFCLSNISINARPDPFAHKPTILILQLLNLGCFIVWCSLDHLCHFEVSGLDSKNKEENMEFREMMKKSLGTPFLLNHLPVSLSNRLLLSRVA